MGTRADFYVGRGPQAEWLGSIAWDGYPSGIPDTILHAAGETTFRREVARFLDVREDATLPEQGWPWPWEDSRTTDYAFAIDDGKVWASSFGARWFDPTRPESDDDEDAGEPGYSEYLAGRITYAELNDRKPTTFPDMSGRKAVTRGSRSGLMIIGATADGRVAPIDPADIDATEAGERG